MNSEKLTISIIVPCYNCQDTLEEALLSIIKHPPRYAFEIVAVDDCSTDNTWPLMQKMATDFPVIKIYRHEKNKGGGATRNTATNHSSADLIFCLDSDDLLTPGTLEKMIDFQKKHNLDGVGIHHSCKFNGTDTSNIIRTDTFSYTDENIPFDALFETYTKRMNPLYSVFLYTKNAFFITGGYPENHGFDTQGFAFRFLANGLIARACPDTTYLHRLNLGKSYYTREYESGEINYNWLKIYIEFFYLWKKNIQEEIFNFPFNHPEKNLHDTLSLQNPIDKDKEKFIQKHTKKIYKGTLNMDNLSYEDSFWLGLTEEDNELSLNHLLFTSKQYKVPLVMYYIMKHIEKITELPTTKIFNMVNNLEKKTLQGSKSLFIVRLTRKIKRVLKSYT